MRTDPRPNSNTGSSPIAQRRIALGMTQQQLAEAIGSTQQMIAKWEMGKRDPRISSLLRLADALYCTVDELIRKNKEGKNMKGEIIVDLINREGLRFDSGVFDDAEKAFDWARGRGSNYRVDFYWRSLGEDASAEELEAEYREHDNGGWYLVLNDDEMTKGDDYWGWRSVSRDDAIAMIQKTIDDSLKC